MSAFAKCVVKGPGAEEWLESIFANKMPQAIGRISLVHMLSLNGGVRAEFTVYKTGPQSYYLVSAGAFETHDHDYLFKLVPKDGSVSVQRVTTQTGFWFWLAQGLVMYFKSLLIQTYLTKTLNG